MTVEGISTPQPPESSKYQAARVAITLVCLIGVPILALVGWGEPARAIPARRYAHAKPAATQLPSTDASASRPAAKNTPFSDIAVSHPPKAAAQTAIASSPSRDRLVRPATFSNNPSTAPAPQRVVSDETSQDRMQSLFERLQSLGATYYKLETVAAGERYWFKCNVAEVAAPFEASDRLPLLAVERVVGEVEAFRSHSTGAQARTSLHSGTIRR